MQMPTPITRDLVLVGGGHTHALVLRMWAMRPLPGARLTLINPGPVAAYSGMLPGFVAGHYLRAALEIDLVRLARLAGARLILGRTIGINRERRHVLIEGRAPAAYDVLSVDIGVTSDLPLVPGHSDFCHPAKPLGTFADRWVRFADHAGADGTAAQVAVIGGGLAGVELAFAARHRLGPSSTVTLIEAAEPLALAGKRARAALFARLKRAGVAVVSHAPVVRIGSNGVTLANGDMVPAQFTIGAAGCVAQGWLADCGLAVEQGFVRVGPTLQSETDPLIFAAGDIAHLAHDPRPKAGVFAVREAPVLFHNLRAALAGHGRMKAYHPQRDYLKLAAAGSKDAVADKWGLRLSGRAIWHWKDRIDRAFMRKFHDLPAMTAPPAPPAPGAVAPERPLCGGCGAKAGRPALERALARLPLPVRSDVIRGAGDDAAILKAGDGYQTLTTDHLRAFTHDPWLMARITAIHALGDIWSMGARPQAALAQVILPLMGEDQQAETLREIMDAAQSVFGPEGADIVGGHTSLGAEMTVGFTVTGLSPTLPLTHAGAQPGDRLILTKPIGTGVILAAEMAGRAPGRVVAGALASMNRPQGAAARILAEAAHAMTDVTGFGLAGHLLSILDASGVAAALDLTAVPILAGAEDLSRAGEGSSLLPANRQAAARMDMAESPRAALLFDPQTAGGLLAAVPEDRAAPALDALLHAGETAAIIGRIEEGAPFIRVSPA